MLYLDTDKVSLHIDDILAKKRTAQKFFDMIQSIKRLIYLQYDVDGNLVLKIQHLIEKSEALVNYYSNQSNQKLLGKVVEVLVLGDSEKDPNKVYGYTDTMKLVNVSGPKDIIGKIVKVKITEAKSFSLDGEYVKEKIEV